MLIRNNFTAICRVQSYWIAIIIFLLVSASTANCQTYNIDAIIQASKGIADWKLLNPTKESENVKQTICVSSSLFDVAKKSGFNDLVVVQGLSAFDYTDFSNWNDKQWELERGVELSSSYTTIMLQHTNPGVEIMSKLNTTQGIIELYKLSPYMQIASTTFNTALNATSTFFQSLDYLGTSAQIMNPPIYLHEKTDLGWEGKESFTINNNIIQYNESLQTNYPNGIIRSHEEQRFTPTGIYYSYQYNSTPVESKNESFMMYHYPVNSYFDPYTSTITTITKNQENYRIETISGIERITPLPNYSNVMWDYRNISPSWNNIQINVPKVDWNYIQNYYKIDWNSIKNNYHNNWSTWRP